ncbi:MAG: glycosyltransferase family 2 protein [Candidatus Omnitrophica bacterium]|nr:glycosyltransferase family 2 protein [Candidatus Omnitrophota bacterium]
MKLSVLMPVYNESRWIDEIVRKVLSQTVEGIREVELIIVDDGSTDDTSEHIKQLAEKYGQQICLYFHEKNKGKGAALQTAIQHMSGDICIVQDADLEYDPHDYPLLLEPIIQGRADCVYGSRFIGKQSKRVLFFWHYVGNRALTLLSNMLTNLNLTDMETCYKAFRSTVLKSIPLRSRRFGFDPEVTAKIAKKKCRIFEVGISYNGRTYEDGKKITWLDGVQAILLIIKYRIID